MQARPVTDARRIERVLHVLSRRKRHPRPDRLAGVGKTAIAEGLGRGSLGSGAVEPSHKRIVTSIWAAGVRRHQHRGQFESA